MRNLSTFRLSCLALALALVAVSPAALAAPVAEMNLGVTQVEWVPTGDYASLTLRVTGPMGVVEHRFAAGENPLFDLGSISGDADGLYKWELTATPRPAALGKAAAAARANGDPGVVDRLRLQGELPARGELVQSGTFRVTGGSIVQPAAEAPFQPEVRLSHSAPASAGAPLQTASAPQTISGDLTVYNSLCVGQDCAANESYGADTIRLKENNTRIHFWDTSNSGSFPTTDWRLVANDQNNGGRSIFYLEDSDTGQQPFSVEAGAPNSALYVDDVGNLGLGTSAPVVEIHVKDGDTPTLRLEQDASSGFAAQTWDIAGNETNFFVRDITNGSLLPFRIRPGAPKNSLYIKENGSVGLGTETPTAPLHVRRTDGTAKVLVEEASSTGAGRTLFDLENNGQVKFRMNDTAQTPDWVFTASNAFQIDNLADVGVEFQINPDGAIVQNGTQIHAPDYVFEPDYGLLSLDSLKTFVAENKHLPNVPSAEDIRRDGLNLTQMPMRLLEKIEELTLYTLAQEDKLDELAQQNAALAAKNAELAKAVEELQQRK